MNVGDVDAPSRRPQKGPRAQSPGPPDPGDLPRHQGHLFAFEGPDNVGKTTVATAVAEELRTLGFRVTYLAFPGRERGSLGAHIYDLHHDPASFGVEAIPPASLQILHLAAHLEAINELIRPAMERGEIVLLDRFWWSIWVYGSTAGVDEALLEAIIDVERVCWDELHPDLVLLLERPGKAGTKGGGGGGGGFVQFALDGAYAALAEREARTQPVAHIDNDRPVRETVGTVGALIRAQLEKRHADPDPGVRS